MSRESELTPSKYQEGIYDWVKNGEGNAVVEAVAGSGKTWTLVESLKLMGGKARFVAFNKHIADELASKCPPHAKVSTIHSMGFAAVRRRLKGIQVNDKKVRGITSDVMGDDYDSRLPRLAAEQLVSVAKLNLTDPTEENLRFLLDFYDIDVNGDEDWVISSVPEILKMDQEDEYCIDFDDMIWLPHILGLNPEKCDWLCVDELQDLNAAQRELVFKALRKGARALAVGDRFQSIFGFCGADTSSIPTVIEMLHAKTLPLSICYRCPRSHIALAKEIVPQIEAAPDAEEGVVRDGQLPDMIGNLRDGDMVICRINAPLAEIAMALVRQGKKAVLRGRDIGTGLINLVQRVNRREKRDDISGILGLLKDYVNHETPKLLAAGKEKKLDSLKDKVETVIALSDGLRDWRGLEGRIGAVFCNDRVGIVCSSIHRAKGLEADRVMLYRPELVPFPKARPGWETDQEWNLKYVALTRAKKELWFAEKQNA